MKKVAILLENLFDEREFIYPYYKLMDAGYQVDVISPEKGKTYAGKEGLTQKSTHASKDICAQDYAAVVIPGGFSPDYMRRTPETVAFVKEMDAQQKPVAAICHGPSMLASAANIKGKTLTSHHAIRDDLIHAGVQYVDVEVAVDGNIVTARKPDDLVPFMQALIALIEKE